MNSFLAQTRFRAFSFCTTANSRILEFGSLCSEDSHAITRLRTQRQRTRDVLLINGELVNLEINASLMLRHSGL